MRAAIEAYLQMRRALGYYDNDIRPYLMKFARFLDARGDRFLRNEVVLFWLERSSGPRQRLVHAQQLRQLAVYLSGEDPRHEVLPDYSVPAYRRENRIPHIYTDDEVLALLDVLTHEGRSDPVDKAAYGHLFGFLAATGVRIGEALKLRLTDFKGDHVHVRGAKFSKERLVYLDPSTCKVLRTYARSRDPSLDADVLFIGASNKAPSRESVEVRFRKATKALGLLGTEQTGPPRLHDLRHTFAVRSLAACGTDQLSVSTHIVALAAYLGHSSMDETYWYLRTLPELKRQILTSMTGGNHA